MTNTCTGTGVRFNVELEWTKKLLDPLTEAEASAFLDNLRQADSKYDAQDPSLRFGGPDWTELDGHDRDVFDLGNGGRPLWFRLDPGDSRHVQVDQLRTGPARNSSKWLRKKFSKNESLART